MDSSETVHEKIHSEVLRGKHASIIHIVNYIIEDAHASKSSDIHIDPSPQEISVRFRIDGMLITAHTLPTSLHSEIIARIKILSKLRTDEHSTAQDGRFRHTFSDTENTHSFLDIRVSILPTYHGENVVLRLLSDLGESFTLTGLGFSNTDSAKILHALHQPHGMILATGPTGSGKTTTLYTLIQILNTPHISIVTIEDPIEYAIQNVKQIQVNPRTGLTFANGLRSILRQDPNTIMVGEIRDTETARIAVNTALTGHLLLSTLHTTDSATTLPRLLDMGIEEYLVASTVHIAIGQRLVRKLCPICKKKGSLSHELHATLSRNESSCPLSPEDTIYTPSGCTACKHTGYTQRISINEVLVVNEPIRNLLLTRASARDIKHCAVTHGMTTMYEDGMNKVKHGITSIDEVLRVIYE